MELSRTIRHYVTLLNRKHREVIELFYFAKIIPEDVANHMGVCVRHMHSIKANAIAQLASML